MKLEDYLSYDLDTGVVSRKYGGGRLKSGDPIGNDNGDDYLKAAVKGKYYKVHRLAWYSYYGVSPKLYIDHINRIRSDNRISNLREVSQRQNNSNKVSHRSGKLVGGYLHKQSGRWFASISINCEPVYLGLFDTEIEAHNAYMSKLQTLRNEGK